MTRLLGALAALTLLITACGSDEDDFRKQLTDLDPSITDETVDCILSELDARGLNVSDISDESVGDGPIPQGGQEALATCLFDDTVADSGSSGSSDSSGTGGADTYGSDPTLDALWDACEGGDGAACDDLYFQSPIGSDYEAFGDTCGRRFAESPGFCENALG